MVDRQKHRGPHPHDEHLFAPGHWPTLRAAVSDLSWLLSKNYAQPSALKLVGDRYSLRERQRTAVRRAACSDQQKLRRRQLACSRDEIANQMLLIDGFNLLTTIEAALSRGVLLSCRDGCIRDMASMHGSYRRVEQTQRAILAIGEYLAASQAFAVWWLDQPVSNSARLAQLLRETASEYHWNWEVRLVPDPDHVLANSDAGLIVTADSGILDRCGPWFDLAGAIVASLPAPWIVPLTDDL